MTFKVIYNQVLFNVLNVKQISIYQIRCVFNETIWRLIVKYMILIRINVFNVIKAFFCIILIKIVKNILPGY